MRHLAAISLLLSLGAALSAQDATDAPTTGATAAPVRFAAVDVFLDSGAGPLAAYQFELKATEGDVALVGIEGGEHRAFASPPYYDPAALNGKRIVVGAFDTGTDLPRGRTRVARLMVQVRGDVSPKYEATVRVAASPDARPIPATISVSEGAER